MGEDFRLILCPQKTRIARHYVFYHDENLLSKVKPDANYGNLIFVNLNELPIPEKLKVLALNEEQNRAIYSEYLGLLQIKPKTNMVGVFTYSIPLKFCEEYAGNDQLMRSVFLPEIRFEYLENKEFDESKLYGAEFSSYFWKGPGSDVLKEIDNSPFHINAIDNNCTGPMKGTVVVRKDVFLDFQKWFLAATEYLLSRYGWQCNMPSGIFKQTKKYYSTQEQSKLDDEFRRKIGHIQERLMAYYFGRVFSEKDRVRLGDFLAKPSLNLIVQYFKVGDNERQKEFDLCLEKNCENSYIKRIFLLTEEKLAGKLLNHPKIEQIVIGKRLAFSDAFKFANEKCNGELCIVSNADIYFDGTLEKIKEYNFDKLFLAISRHNHFADGRDQIIIGGSKYNTKNVQKYFDEEGGKIEWGSQDSWIFKAPISENIIKDSNFELGRLACDSHIAWIAKTAGYRVQNPCFNIITRHLHNVFFGVSRQNMEEHLSTTIAGALLAINPDGSSYPAERTWIQGGSSKGKIKMYVAYTPSHEYFFNNFFLPSLKDDYFLIVEKHNQECKTGFFEDPGWMDTMKRKIGLVVRAIKENPGNIFIHSDVDIQFFGKTKDIILQSLYDKDIVFQRDRHENKKSGEQGVYCAGFFACRSNEVTLEFFERILKELDNAVPPDNDQTLINDFLQKKNNKVNAGYLPDIFWSPGINYGITGWLDDSGEKIYHWEPGQELEPPSGIVMHHANWTKGVDNKKIQLELVKEKAFKKYGF